MDRDLKTLVESGEVRKLAYGLYCRPRKKDGGAAPPDQRELLRAFLKTDDFLLTSDEHFTGLGLGLTPPRNNYFVYNHKRAGDFRLGGTRFSFRLAPAYPKKLSKEYLLVDLLNNPTRWTDDVDRVLDNLKSHFNEFDEDKLRENLQRYGRPAARAALKRAARDRRAGMPLRIVVQEDDRADLRYWLRRSPAERVAAVEFLREQYYALSGRKALPRLAPAVSARDRPA